MPVHTATLELSTRGHGDVVDITDRVRRALSDSKLQSGIGCVFVPGATGGVTSIEYEPGCVKDLQRVFDEIAPAHRDWEHERRWGDGNGHSHVRAALLGPSLSFPFVDGEPMLGTWQQIVFVDFDNKSRARRLIVQLVGE
jgi:secondary thiamine-phosphate synthase enzyme